MLPESQDPLGELERLLALEQEGQLRTYQEVDGLARAYQRAAAALARARATPGHKARRLHLESLTRRAHFVVYRSPRHKASDRVMGFVRAVAVALHSTRRLQRVTALLFALGMMVGFTATFLEPQRAYTFMSLMFPAELVQDLLHSPEARQAYIESGRGAGSGFKAVFAASLAANNTRVALTAFALGIFFAVPTAIVQLINGALVGSMAALYHRGQTATEFWAWVLPHGIPEMWALIVAGAGGLLLGSTLINPRNRPRREALEEASQRALALLGLAALMLFYAALIEGFFRQSTLSSAPRYAVAVVHLVVISWGLRRWAEAGAPPSGRPLPSAQNSEPPD